MRYGAELAGCKLGVNPQRPAALNTIGTVKILSSYRQITDAGRIMAKGKSSYWLALDSVLLVVCVVLLVVDVVIVQDMIFSLVALGGVFIFSVRLGRDVRSRNTMTT